MEYEIEHDNGERFEEFLKLIMGQIGLKGVVFEHYLRLNIRICYKTLDFPPVAFVNSDF